MSLDGALCEADFKAKIWCLSMWCNGCSFDLSICMSRVRILKGLLFFLNKGRIFKNHFFPQKWFFFCQFQQMLETISNYQKFLVTRFQRSFYVSLFFNSGIIKHINSNLWNRSVSKMITFICFNQKQFFNFFLKFNLFFTQWLTSKFLY